MDLIFHYENLAKHNVSPIEVEQAFDKKRAGAKNQEVKLIYTLEKLIEVDF